MKIDQDTSGSTMKAVVRSMARPMSGRTVREKAPYLVAKGQVFGT